MSLAHVVNSWVCIEFTPLFLFFFVIIVLDFVSVIQFGGPDFSLYHAGPLAHECMFATPG